MMQIMFVFFYYQNYSLTLKTKVIRDDSPYILY